MEESTLRPFIRHSLNILFVGLNPAEGSSRQGHYFSVNAAFWNQLFRAGLITSPVNKATADSLVFGSNEINRNGWNYGITDLITDWAESNSSKMAPKERDCTRLIEDIQRYEPRTVVLLHSKVVKSLAKFLGTLPLAGRHGWLGRLIQGVSAEFFSVPFPHGNTYSSEYKVRLYQEVVAWLEGNSDDSVPIVGHLDTTSLATTRPRQSGPTSLEHTGPFRSKEARVMTHESSSSSPLLDRARFVDALIAQFLEETGMEVAKPKDVMPLLVRRGVYPKDYREGLPLRRDLRQLNAAGLLSVMKTAYFEQGPKNKSWYFRLPR